MRSFFCLYSTHESLSAAQHHEPPEQSSPFLTLPSVSFRRVKVCKSWEPQRPTMSHQARSCPWLVTGAKAVVLEELYAVPIWQSQVNTRGAETGWHPGLSVLSVAHLESLNSCHLTFYPQHFHFSAYKPVSRKQGKV